jgi:hypothetical protein
VQYVLNPAMDVTPEDDALATAGIPGPRSTASFTVRLIGKPLIDASRTAIRSFEYARTLPT